MDKEFNPQLDNKELYDLKKEKKLEEQRKQGQNRIVKKTLKIFIPLIVIGGIIGWFLWREVKKPAAPPAPQEEIISRRGIHWHPELTILIKGQKQEIQANLGIGIRHEPIHTHDSSGVLHLEMQGLVRKKDIELGRFFEIWGKQFNLNCIFEFCNGSEGTVKMFVNSQENAEFENYQMKDGDKIEIRYE